MKMQTPGRKTSQMECVKYCWALLSMMPQTWRRRMDAEAQVMELVARDDGRLERRGSATTPMKTIAPAAAIPTPLDRNRSQDHSH